MNIRSIKTAQCWCWQDKDIIRLIRENFSGQRLTTALAIYHCLTELASNQGVDEFLAYYSQIAKLSGKSPSTIKLYCKEFIKLNVLAKENRKAECRTNLSNRWSLLTPSVNNNYQTSSSYNNSTSSKDIYQQLEEKELEKNNQNGINNLLETEAYKRLREKVQGIRGAKIC